MNDVRLRWSVWPWVRVFDEDPVTRQTLPDVQGAAITDSRREVTYRATVDAQGHLDHLEVVLDGFVDDARLDRLRSIPRERIEATVSAFVREYEPDVLMFVPEGGLLAREGSRPRGRALYAEVARLMVTRGWGRQELAAYYLPDEEPKAAVRRMDHWIDKAREFHPDIAPRPATGKGYRANKTTDGK